MTKKIEVIDERNITESETILSITLLFLMRSHGLSEITVTYAQMLEDSQVQPPLGLAITKKGGDINVKVMQRGDIVEPPQEAK